MRRKEKNSMIKVEKLSYSFSQKELYRKVSFIIEDGQHCALIGSNGTGKTTLIDMLMDTEDKYIYDGKIIKEGIGRVGYVSQFAVRDKIQETTVFDYLATDFVVLQKRQELLCEKMATENDLDLIFEEYQKCLDEYQAIDGENYDRNIHKQLNLAGLQKVEHLSLEQLSGGEYKLLQVIRQMLLQPSLLIMDEPDVFLDFGNLNGLMKLIHSYKGTVLVITHNRYLLEHCFNKILHLENGDIQEFDGTYPDYRFTLLCKKLELQEAAQADWEEIERNRKMVERMRKEATNFVSSSKGNTLHARVSYLERLEARQIKAPFVELRTPDLCFPQVEMDEELDERPIPMLTISDYHLCFEEVLLDQIHFQINKGEKVALVGPNGTGKTTLLREIYKNQNSAIQIMAKEIGFLSQLQEENLNPKNSIYEEFEGLEFTDRAQIERYLSKYCFAPDTLERKIKVLSGGEKNLLQLAKLALSGADLLLLDEPTSHLDVYAQVALEKAVQEYQGTVLMVSHDFYTIANCVDYVLLVEEKGIRRMSIRAFRRMIYEKHFSKEYLEIEQKKKELELRIETALKKKDLNVARKLCMQLESFL